MHMSGKKREPRAPKLPKQPNPFPFVDLIDEAMMTVRAAVLEASRELPQERWDQLLAEFREQVDNIEQIAAKRSARSLGTEEPGTPGDHRRG
jgi:hypothetical protein